MSDREQRGLKGPVHTLREEHIYPGNSGPGMLTVTTFNEAGDVIEMASRQRDGKMQTWPVTKQDCDECRFVTFEKSKDPGERPTAHPPRVEKKPGPKDGQKTTIYFLPNVEKSQGVAMGFRETKGGFASVGDAATITSIEDASGREIELIAHNAEHIVMMHGVRTFDEQGRPKEEIFYTGDFLHAALKDTRGNPLPKEALEAFAAAFPHGSEFSRTTYRYDEKGRLAEKTMSMAMGPESHNLYAYDAHGNEIEVTSTEDGRTTKHRFEYVYDDHGNWTRKTGIHASGPSTTTIRTITYY